MTRVISNIDMIYNSIRRYKGEIFALGGFANDDKLVRVGHVRPITADNQPPEVPDDSGRVFVSEQNRLAYRISAPQGAVIITGRRTGRPPGSRNKAKATI